ncbi:MAG TPA: thioesterase family protein [Acidimicrobiales bacterium]|nr:thioesterase family protein [Acidimicrobiales bacterium]
MEGDLAADTSVEATGEPGRFTATLSPAWEIWGPMGGYVAAVALRAAGEVSPFARPASFSCHYLGVAAFDTVEIEVVALRNGRAATSHRVSITQGGRSIMEALVWSVDDVDGLEHDESARPAVPPPSDLRSSQELAGDDAPPPFPFWRNFDTRPLEWHDPWPPQEPLPAVWRNWLRFLAWPPDPDPWLAAARLVLLADLPSWPSGHRPHAWQQPPFIAPTLDLQVTLHRLVPGEEWLLLEGTSPVAADGMIGFTSRLWTVDGRLVASGGGQTLCRPVPTSG